MLASLIALIFTLIIIGVVWWALQRLMALIPLAEPFRTIVYVLSVLLMVLIVLYVMAQVLGIAGIHVPIFR